MNGKLSYMETQQSTLSFKYYIKVCSYQITVEFIQATSFLFKTE